MNPIVCMTGVELLMDYLDDVLPDEVRAAIEEHVTSCPRCTAFVESYRQTPRILRDATAAALPADLEASLQAFLRERTPAFKPR
jgi:anti-sigma factor RsiW